MHIPRSRSPPLPTKTSSFRPCSRGALLSSTFAGFPKSISLFAPASVGLSPQKEMISGKSCPLALVIGGSLYVLAAPPPTPIMCRMEAVSGKILVLKSERPIRTLIQGTSSRQDGVCGFWGTRLRINHRGSF